MRVLVTRQSEDARRTAEAIARLGHESMIAPLSEIRLLDTEEPDLSNVQALLATSSNGVRAIAGRAARKDVRLFAVGENTAAMARSAGFTNVFSAEGDSRALATVVCKALDPSAGPVLHVAGKGRGSELHQTLAEAGFECRVWELYEIVARRTLPKNMIDAFLRGTVDALLVLSPESGRLLAAALKAGGVTSRCDHVLACCISEAAAETIREIEFGAIKIAERPALDAVLALLESGTALGQPGG